MSETNETPNDEERFDKLEIKVKDINNIEYLVLFQALTDKIDITCTQINDEDIFYT